MSKIETAKGLTAIALNPSNPAKQRLDALLEASKLRAEMKVGWQRLTPDGGPVVSAVLEAELRRLVAKDEQADKALDEIPADVEALISDGNDDEPEGNELADAGDPPPGIGVPVETTPKRKPKADAKPKDSERGKISALVRELLLGTDLPYADIVSRVKAEHPEAKTTARSVASVASDLRTAGQAVSVRRAPAK
jgi:hypothetical protein